MGRLRHLPSLSEMRWESGKGCNLELLPVAESALCEWEFSFLGFPMKDLREDPRSNTDSRKEGSKHKAVY